MSYFSIRANFANKICLNKKKKKLVSSMALLSVVILLSLFHPLTPVSAITGCDIIAFGIIYSQFLQGEKIFAMTPRSEWFAQWILRYAQHCSKSEVKNSEENFQPVHVATPWYNFLSRWCFLRILLNWKQVQLKLNHRSKKKRKWEKGKAKKN